MDAGTGSLLLTANVAHMWRGCYGSDGFRCGKTYSRDFRLLLLLLPLQVTPTLSLSLSLSLSCACLLRGLGSSGTLGPKAYPPWLAAVGQLGPYSGRKEVLLRVPVFTRPKLSLSLSLPPSAHIDSRKHGLS